MIGYILIIVGLFQVAGVLYTAITQNMSLFSRISTVVGGIILPALSIYAGYYIEFQSVPRMMGGRR